MKTKIITSALKSLFLLIFAFTISETVWAQTSITAIGTAVTQNFDDLYTNYDGTWTDNSNLTGWYAKTDATSTIVDLGENDGSITTAGLYSFGIDGTNMVDDRALGFAPSTAFTGTEAVDKGYIGWRLKNNTSKNIGTIQIKWTGEQWRRESVSSAQYIVLRYQIGSSVTNLTSGTYVLASSQFASPINTNGTAYEIDGNDPANQSVDITIEINVNLPAGQEIMLRWEDIMDPANNLMAIDDVTFTAIKESQTITFGALSSRPYVSSGTFTLGATASSSLTVTYASSNLSVITILGNTATIHSAGQATITASQAGNSIYAPAVDVPQVQIIVPAAPVAIAATSINTGGFTANWNASAGGAEEYWVYISTDSFATTLTTASAGTNLSFPVTSLLAYTPYFYRLRGKAGTEYSGYSNIIKVTTSVGVQTFNLLQTANGFTTTTLTWEKGNEESRIVFLREGTGTSCPNPVDNTNYTARTSWSGKGTQIGTSGFYCIYKGTGTTVSLTNLYPGREYTVEAFEFNSISSSTAKFLTTVNGANNPITFTPWGTTTFTNTTAGQSTPEAWSTAARWDHATVPTADLPTAVLVYIDGNCEVTNAAVANNLTINATHGSINPKLTINPTKSLTVINTLTNNNDTAGIRIKSTSAGTGSLIESTTGVKATVERWIPYTVASDEYIYHYVASPITSALSKVYQYAWLYSWVEPTKVWYNIIPTNVSLSPMKGYNLRLKHIDPLKNPGIPPNNPVIYRGVLNTGTVGSSGNLTYNGTDDHSIDGWNLIGNPYTSGIDWDATSGWTKTNIENAVYYWVNSQYEAYVNGTGTGGVTGYIAAQQGFFVHLVSPGSGTIQMDNRVRTHTGASIFRAAAGNILRLKITPANLLNEFENMSDETVIRFVDGATSNFDGNFDAYKLFGLKDYPQLYTLTGEGRRASINAFSDVEIDSTKVNMNLRIGLRNNYKITATGMESFDKDAYIAIEDTKLNTIQVLTENPIYSFYGDTSDFEKRFVVWFYPKPVNQPNGVGNISHDDINIYSNHKTISVNLNGINANELTIMNMLGQTVDKRNITSNKYYSFETNLPTGLYIVRIATTDGKTFEKKIYLEK